MEFFTHLQFTFCYEEQAISTCFIVFQQFEKWFEDLIGLCIPMNQILQSCIDELEPDVGGFAFQRIQEKFFTLGKLI